MYVQRLGDGLGHVRRARHIGEINEPDSIVLMAAERRRETHGKPRLTDAARTNKCQQPGASLQVNQLVELHLPPDESAELSQEISADWIRGRKHRRHLSQRAE